MNETEIYEARKAKKFVIKAVDKKSLRATGNPFETPLPRTVINCVYAVLEKFNKKDLPQLKKFAAERLKCSIENVEVEIFEPL